MRWASALLAAAVCLQTARDEETTLAFRPAQPGFFSFDTGTIRGTVRQDGSSQGVSSLVHVPTGVEVAHGGGLPGVLSYRDLDDVQVAPGARMDDGLFDVVVWDGFGLTDLVVKRPMLYDGTHVRLPNTRVLRGRVVEAEPMEGAQVHLDVDGENPGTLPARFSILPGCLRIRVGA